MSSAVAPARKTALKTVRATSAVKVTKVLKAKRVSKIAKGARARASVLAGGKEKTFTGLKKPDLLKDKTGLVVTRKPRAAGVKAFTNSKSWTVAVQEARVDLGVKGVVPVKKGASLLKAAKAIYILF